MSGSLQPLNGNTEMIFEAGFRVSHWAFLALIQMDLYLGFQAQFIPRSSGNGTEAGRQLYCAPLFILICFIRMRMTGTKKFGYFPTFIFDIPNNCGLIPLIGSKDFRWAIAEA
jgi:hypothetical protein